MLIKQYIIYYAILLIGLSSAAHGDFRVTALGKTYKPPKGRVAVSGSKSWPGDGGPSIRNTDREHLVWKKQGYFQRNRDVGQVFLPKQDLHLDAIVLRLGPSDNAVKAGAPGAELFLQFFEVIGKPRIKAYTALGSFSTVHIGWIVSSI